MPATSFWLHGIAVAVLSERLAQRTRAADVRQAFTAGLLHDVGKLVIGDFLEQESGAVREKMQRLTFLDAEHEVLGTDHCEVGLTVAQRWSLPPEVGQAARWHHAPESAQAHQSTVDVVHVANVLAQSFGLGTDIGELSRHFSSEAAGRLGLDREGLDRLMGESFDDVMTYAHVMGEPQGGA
jgi:putative nucleotidyltransferase with HDIG domain